MESRAIRSGTGWNSGVEWYEVAWSNKEWYRVEQSGVK